MIDVDKEFAVMMKQRRKEWALTQDELAEGIDIRRNVIQGIEACNQKPSLSQAVRISVFLKMSIDTLVSKIRREQLYEELEKLDPKVRLSIIELMGLS